MNDITNLETYDYDLPEELIAQVPLENRSESRMLVYNKQNKTIEHKHFYDITHRSVIKGQIPWPSQTHDVHEIVSADPFCQPEYMVLKQIRAQELKYFF